MASIIYKQPSEKIIVYMDFSNKMTTGEAVTGIVTGFPVSNPSGLTFSGESFSGKVVQFYVEGGTVPQRKDINEVEYKVTCQITTSNGQIIEGDGILIVREV